MKSNVVDRVYNGFDLSYDEINVILNDMRMSVSNSDDYIFTIRFK